MKLIYPVLLSLACVSMSFSAIAQERSSSPVATEVTAKNIVARGNQKFARGDLDGAIADYKQALKVKPDYARAYFDLGAAYCNLGDSKTEIAYLTQAIRYNPKDPDSFTERGIASIRLNDIKGAMPDFNQALKLNPKHARAYWGLGQARQFRGDAQGAEAAYTESLRLDPTFAQPYLNRGNAYLELGSLDHSSKANYQQKAFADYTKAIQLDPDFAQAYHSRGSLYEALNNKKAAIADYQTAAQIYSREKMTANYQEEIHQLELVQK